MLVLTRKRDERIFIGDDIVLVVVGIRGDKVRLGIQAPSGVVIQREELAIAVDEHLADGRQGP